MATKNTSKIQKIGTILRNPTFQKVFAWAAPIVLGWVLSKFDKSSKTTKK